VTPSKEDPQSGTVNGATAASEDVGAPAEANPISAANGNAAADAAMDPVAKKVRNLNKKVSCNLPSQVTSCA
jgi:hypothetical protein